MGYAIWRWSLELCVRHIGKWKTIDATRQPPEPHAPAMAEMETDAEEFARARLGFEPDARQAAVLRSAGKQVILNCSRQWGKSTVTAAKAIHRAYSRPGSTILVAAPAERQAREFLRKASGMLRKLEIAPRGDGDNPGSLLLPNGSRVVALPGREDTVRGFSAVSMLLVDEASRVEEPLFEALIPMLATSGGELWLMSTPAGRRGFFYEAWVHGGPDWERFSVPVTECPRIPAAFVERERRRMVDGIFRQEFLCEFVDREGSAFETELIEGAFDDGVEILNIGRR